MKAGAETEGYRAYRDHQHQCHAFGSGASAIAHWHLYGNYVNGRELGGFLDYVRIFTFIGVLVLIIACINFIKPDHGTFEKTRPGSRPSKGYRLTASRS